MSEWFCLRSDAELSCSSLSSSSSPYGGGFVSVAWSRPIISISSSKLAIPGEFGFMVERERHQVGSLNQNMELSGSRMKLLDCTTTCMLQKQFIKANTSFIKVSLSSIPCHIL